MSVNHDSGDCFHDEWLELMEFAAKYERLGRLGFDDWQIVSEVASVVSKMLREGRESGCPNLEDAIVDVVVRTLDNLGIDRYSIMRGYLHGTTEDVRRILKRIFPNVEQMTGLPPPPSPIRARTGIIDFRRSPPNIDHTQPRNTSWGTMSSMRFSPSSVGRDEPPPPPSYVPSYRRGNKHKPSLNKEPSGESVKKRSRAIGILKKIGKGIGLALVIIFVGLFLLVIFGISLLAIGYAITWLIAHPVIGGLILIIIILIILIATIPSWAGPHLEPPR